MQKPSLVIISPALQEANNGNWQTARRWARMLAGHYRTRIATTWAAADAQATQDQVMIALHARRSAAAVAAWHAARGARGLALVLTGTDLYGDIHTHAQAQQSLELAQRLVVLQELGAQQLPLALRHKAVTIFQSCPTRRAAHKTARHLNAVMVGHLREEKSPQTLFEAAHILQTRSDIRIKHIGAGLDPQLAQLATKTGATCAHYTWAGGLNHSQTRNAIAHAHVLVHTSRVEGGAHVIMEAVCSGTPVLASRIDGNLGMLGADYSGYFAHGDAPALARLLLRCRDDANFLAHLHSQCNARAPLFAPQAEQRSLLQLAASLE
jgi:putative glycosyltransferase (TIGR04348 family)